MTIFGSLLQRLSNRVNAIGHVLEIESGTDTAKGASSRQEIHLAWTHRDHD